MTPQEFAGIFFAQVGDPYVLGAEIPPLTPDPVRGDCSEYMEWGFGMAGVYLPDGAWLQYEVTEPVTDSPRIGDLVFKRNNAARPNGIGHVGVIVDATLGAERVFEAKGKDYGCVVSSLAAWRASSTFAGIRRVSALEAALSKEDDMIPDIPAVGFIGLHRWSKGDDRFLAVTKDQMLAAVAAGYDYDGMFELAPGGTVPLHMLDRPGYHLYLPADRIAAEGDGWTDRGVLVMVHAVGQGATIHRHARAGGHNYGTQEHEGEPAWTYDGPAFGLGELSAGDPVQAVKAARFDVMKAVADEPLE